MRSRWIPWRVRAKSGTSFERAMRRGRRRVLFVSRREEGGVALAGFGAWVVGKVGSERDVCVCVVVKGGGDPGGI